MISFIKWTILDLSFTNALVLTSSGLGYDILINELTYSKLTLDEETSLYLYHHKTENSENLFWFLDLSEKKLFSELIKISWVWWKVAMQILSLWKERLVLAISNEDNKTIESIKGIGKKMAEKIILELKDKDFGISFSSSENYVKANTIDPNLHTSIKSTLTNMGYNPKDIDKELSSLPEGIDTAWDIIPYIIKSLS